MSDIAWGLPWQGREHGVKVQSNGSSGRIRAAAGRHSLVLWGCTQL
ncbi:hypothetical protein [Lysobacter gummosus]